jgi:putative tricarboxylic transport membrane protein
MMMIAAVAMIDSRNSAMPDTTGTAPGGLGPGFYPFWAAFVVFAGGAWVLYRTLTTPQAAEGVFKGRRSVTSVLALGVPMAIAVALLPTIGIYLMTGSYMGFFAATIGRYKWYWVVAIALGFPLAIYLAFETGFRISLPKSIFYDTVPF